MLDFYIKGEKYLAQFVLFSHNEILNGARVGSNEGCWTNVRRGSVTLLSQNWQLLLCTLLASHPNSAESSPTLTCQPEHQAAQPFYQWDNNKKGKGTNILIHCK